jgi:methylglutaconyl-CoA hydratase
MPYESLIVRREQAVEYVTLNRPAVRNAFNEGMIEELYQWAQAAAISARSGELRAAVLAGAGPVFCAGADLAWMARAAAFSEAENEQDARAAARMFAALNELPLAVIGRIHGAAMGGGAGLAAVCDVVVSDTDAIFAFSEVRLGIVPAIIAPYALSKIGPSAARELFLTGSQFPAARARDIGLVHAVVPKADLDARVAGVVADILRSGPQAIAAAKALIASVWPKPIDETTQTLTVQAIAKRRVSDEGQEGIRAFLEKRKPWWFR